MLGDIRTPSSASSKPRPRAGSGVSSGGEPSGTINVRAEADAMERCVAIHGIREELLVERDLR
jgi:hypothetical protein